ncbi:unnamed protein product [Sphenostylis stenocarpa]|uniref:Uncharacterized protein n=1 Tax=Sphenostylis stenocarpa TaxID=92480 RepID=A0AA86SMX6_9FABA|nr:unnamed protein product [Sphenostylis stenocarpa]
MQQQHPKREEACKRETVNHGIVTWAGLKYLWAGFHNTVSSIEEINIHFSLSHAIKTAKQKNPRRKPVALVW